MYVTARKHKEGSVVCKLSKIDVSKIETNQKAAMSAIQKEAERVVVSMTESRELRCQQGRREAEISVVSRRERLEVASSVVNRGDGRQDAAFQSPVGVVSKDDLAGPREEGTIRTVITRP